MPNEESERVRQVIHYFHSPTLFIQRGSCDSEAENVNVSLKCLGHWKVNLRIKQKGLLVLKIFAVTSWKNISTFVAHFSLW